MRFLVDMNISPKVAEWLRDRGHNAVHLQDEGLERLDDAAVFRKAAAENRVVVTFDLDFGAIMALSRERHTGVVLLRLRSFSTDWAMSRLQVAIERAAPALKDGAVVIVDDSRIRIRRLAAES